MRLPSHGSKHGVTIRTQTRNNQFIVWLSLYIFLGWEDRIHGPEGASTYNTRARCARNKVTIQSVGDRRISRAPLATGNDLMLFGDYGLPLARHYARVAGVLVRECCNTKPKERRRADTTEMFTVSWVALGRLPGKMWTDFSQMKLKMPTHMVIFLCVTRSIEYNVHSLRIVLDLLSNYNLYSLVLN